MSLYLILTNRMHDQNVTRAINIYSIKHNLRFYVHHSYGSKVRGKE